MTDQATHQQASDVAISATWGQAADGSYTATVRVSGLASEEQAKGDVRRMREALSEPVIQQALPELPDTPYGLHYEWPDDEDGFGGSEVIGDSGYTADQMRAYARDAIAHFLDTSGQYVTNDASRQAAIDAAVAAAVPRPFTAVKSFGDAVLSMLDARIAEAKRKAHPFMDKFGDHPETLVAAEAQASELSEVRWRVRVLGDRALTQLMKLKAAAPSPGAEGTIKDRLIVGGQQ